MAYNRKNYLIRVLKVQEIYLEYQEKGLSNIAIWRRYIRDVYHISLTTMYNYLAVNAKGELKKIEMQEIKEFDIIEYANEERHWVALPVTQEQLDAEFPLNAEKPGLHVFSGFWYGTNARNPKSYGKIRELPDELYKITGNLNDFTKKQLKEIL